MSALEILLLNYFSVLVLTITLGIFIKNPDTKIKSFSIWYWLSHALLALVLYKVIQIYDGFKIIYAADLLFFLVYVIGLINFRSTKDNKITQLAKVIPRIHKLSTDEFCSLLITLFKAYGFQSVKQVIIQNDDSNDTTDYYLLARHEGRLVEIRVVNHSKILTVDQINQVASNFRDSTSQATSWLLATSAKSDENTNIFIRNSGADIKVFDLQTICELVYLLSPHSKPNNGFFKKTSIHIIDFFLNVLSKAKFQLESEHFVNNKSSYTKAPQEFLTDVLSDTSNSKPSTIDLFDENNLKDTDDKEVKINTDENKIKRKKKKNENKENVQQCNLQFSDEKVANDSSVKKDSDSLNSVTDIHTLNMHTILEDQTYDFKDGLATKENSDIGKHYESLAVEKEANPLDDIDIMTYANKVVEPDLSSFNELSKENVNLITKTVNTDSDINIQDTNIDLQHDKEYAETNEYLLIGIGDSDPVDENIDLQNEIDPLEHLDDLLKVEAKPIETDFLDDFPETVESDNFLFSSDGTIDLFASNGEEISSQASDKNNEINNVNLHVIPEQECDLLNNATDAFNTGSNPVEGELTSLDNSNLNTNEKIGSHPIVKIDLTDIGAALPHEKTFTTKNRNSP